MGRQPAVLARARWFAVAMAMLTLALPSAATAASPSDAEAQAPPALYCNRLPPGLPAGYACIAEETIEILRPGQRGGDPSIRLQPGVLDKWTWKRNATIYVYVQTNGVTRHVGSIRESQKVTLNGRQSNTEMSMGAFIGGPIKPWLWSQCQKDNSWFPTTQCDSSLVAWTTWTTATVYNRDVFFHSEDDQYWYKYTRKFWMRDYRNPSTADGSFWAPEAYIDSAHFVCSRGHSFSEQCKFT